MRNNISIAIGVVGWVVLIGTGTHENLAYAGLQGAIGSLLIIGALHFHKP